MVHYLLLLPPFLAGYLACCRHLGNLQSHMLREQPTIDLKCPFISLFRGYNHTLFWALQRAKVFLMPSDMMG